MSKDCLVSVFCTAYNHEEYIRDALEGIVSQQTDFPFELLVNDDASTDGTAAIIREYAEKYPDIVRPFYQEKNLFSQGLDIYYAVFFPNASGKYMASCEGDDYWTDPTKLQRQVDFMEAHPEYSACVHNTLLHYCTGDRPDEELVQRSEDCDVEFADIIPGMNTAWHTSALMAKMPLLADPPDFYYVADKYGFSDYPYGIWLRHNGPVHFIARTMSVYRICSNGAAWSSGVEGQYDKLVRFMTGSIAMLETYRHHVTDPDVLRLVDDNILKWKFQLLYTQGKDKELRRPPYNRLLKEKPLHFRINNAVKCLFPSLHRLYRRKQGYDE